jgi:tetratricopeptide (TPR) repeat protein
MKRSTVRRLLIVPALLAASCAYCQNPQVTQDALFLRNGEKVVGRLTAFDGLTIRLQRMLAPMAGDSNPSVPVRASVAVLRSHVGHIEFASNAARDLLLQNATVASLSEIETLWREAQPWLSIPRSPSAGIGLVYGNLLLQKNDPVSAQKAFDLFKVIEKESWHGPTAMRAKQGRMRAMVAMGAVQEAVAEAQEIVRTWKDPKILAEAKFILAKAAEAALRKLSEDNPRWEEDVFVRPERDRLFEQALEFYLYPALFLGSESEVAARGLWNVVEICRFAGDLRQALEASADLLAIYPNTSYAKLARGFSESLPESIRKQHNEIIAK